jgi:NAD(P)-dependent dehydrogenase (short-subunit alcohol dehydrogenase family)
VRGRLRRLKAHAECEAAGSKALAIETDIADRVACARLVGEAARAFDGVDIAVCNASVGLYDKAELISEADWNRTVSVSLSGYFNVAQAAGRQMLLQGRGGSIIALSANSSLVAYEELTAASSAKAAVDQMCRNLALEWGPQNIRVNALNPGYTEHVPHYGDVSTGAGSDLEEGIRQSTPLRRRGRVGEFVWPAVLLASEASS